MILMMTRCQGLHARVGENGSNGGKFGFSQGADHMHIMPLQAFGINGLQGWLMRRICRVQFWAG